MKKLFFCSYLIFLLMPVMAQETQLYEPVIKTEDKPVLYLGTSTGINNISGFLGINAEGRIFNNFTIHGAAGVGSWGYKTGIGIRYYKNYPIGIFYSFSFSSASGFEDLELELETNQSTSDTINLNLNRANNLNFTLGYQFKIFTQGRLHFELGYAARLERRPYEILTPGVTLTTTSQQIIDTMVPGGIILSLGISVGL